MSHYGECDVESKGTRETTGTQQPIGRAHVDRAGIHIDGTERTPHQAHSGGLQGGGSSRPGSRLSRSGAPNAISEFTKDAVLHLARTRYFGTNHTHMSEL